MRIPTAWDDQGLLEDEPFLSQFPVRVQMSQSMRSGRPSDLHHPASIHISEELKSMSDGNDIVQRWINLAFHRSSQLDPEKPPKLGDEMILIFIEFYWKFFQKKDYAYAYLRKERRERGYNDMPDHGSNEIVKLATKPPHQKVGTHKSRRSKSSVQKRQRGGVQTIEQTDRGVDAQTRPRNPDFRVHKKIDIPHSDSAVRSNDVVPLSLGVRGAVQHQPASPEIEPSIDVEAILFTSSQRTPNLAGSALPKPVYTENKDSLIGVRSGNRPLYDVGEGVSIADITPPIPSTSGIPDGTSKNDRYQVPLPMTPPIWATSRQEVCESFDWFRAYQSGVYHIHGSVKGYLLSAFSSLRDRFEHGGRLIISHGGGKAESLHSCKGHISTQLADDQLAHDKSVRSLISNYQNNRPIALLIDDKYALFPYDLGYKGIAYAVLGFYTIRYAWAEFEPSNNDRGRVIRHKFLFQWCAGQGEPWWIPQDSDKQTLGGSVSVVPTTGKHHRSRPVRCLGTGSLDLQYLDSPIHTRCSHCSENIPQVYQLGWACLNSACPRFWLQAHGEPLPLQLDYNAEFLRLLPPMSLPPGFAQLCPPSPPTASMDGVTTDYTFSRGWHCRKCGRLSCRYKWEHWECASCGSVVTVAGRLRCAKEFWGQRIPAFFHDHYIFSESKIIRMPMRVFAHDDGMGQIQSFILSDDRGAIHHIQAGNPVARLVADEIFREYQEQAATGELAFRRWPLRSHKLRGPLLTNYFSQNTGEPYQYVGGTANTVPFNQAPSAVVKARQLIERRILQALGAEARFNEVLSAAYMERQKMAFHSDNEKGLGPIVAGLSLGAPAIMHFRLHSKYEIDKERRNNALSFVLRHGDVLVMEGAKIQECYEHTVAPTNFRIAATARYIEPSHE